MDTAKIAKISIERFAEHFANPKPFSSGST
jgi:hypothetical protein